MQTHSSGRCRRASSHNSPKRTLSSPCGRPFANMLPSSRGKRRNTKFADSRRREKSAESPWANIAQGSSRRCQFTHTSTAPEAGRRSARHTHHPRPRVADTLRHQGRQESPGRARGAGGRLTAAVKNYASLRTPPLLLSPIALT